jgi:hypothetical protein
VLQPSRTTSSYVRRSTTKGRKTKNKGKTMITFHFLEQRHTLSFYHNSYLIASTPSRGPERNHCIYFAYTLPATPDESRNKSRSNNSPPNSSHGPICHDCDPNCHLVLAIWYYCPSSVIISFIRIPAHHNPSSHNKLRRHSRGRMDFQFPGRLFVVVLR